MIEPFLLAALILLPDRAQAKDASPVSGAPWINMFNGSTLAGWDGDPASWEVRDSAICSKGTTSSNTFLIWKDLEGDFLMEADAYIPGQGEANSGIQFRSKGARTGAEGPRWKVCGPQADLGPQKYGALYQECQGRIIPPDSSKCRTAGRADLWNHYELRVEKSNWSLRMNGVTCFDYQDKSGSTFSIPGLVALQFHAPGYPVRFRNLRIQRLGNPASLARIRPGAGRARDGTAPLLPGWPPDGRQRYRSFGADGSLLPLH